MTHLVQWGYPYVFECFQFHMTLTGRAATVDRQSVALHLERLFKPLLDEDFHIDAVTLFEQKRPQSDFVAISRFEFRRP